MNILILGANGMIGGSMMRTLSERRDWQVSGTMRSPRLSSNTSNKILYGVDLSNSDFILNLLNKTKPDVVVNCVGLTKHVPGGNEPIPALTMNALLPHRLNAICQLQGARLIHISTDCVFSGRSGNYDESAIPDADDVYGRTKCLGEITNSNALTLRTSTIGHETNTSFGLLEWFLSQSECKGYRRAIFSGLPTDELARVVRDVVIPNTSLRGLYHVGGAAIDKYALLLLIANAYRKEINVQPEDLTVIDRSLNSERFTRDTGYKAENWETLIDKMHATSQKRDLGNV